MENKWENTINVQEKKACLEIESTDEFDRNFEVGCSWMMKFDGGQLFNIPNFLECCTLGHSHETKFIENVPIEEEIVEYELDGF